MFETMFSGNPFGYFDSEFENFNPWTSYLPRSASRRNARRTQPWRSPFWEVPLQYEKERPSEEPTQKKYQTTHRKCGRKCCQKNESSPSDSRCNSTRGVPMRNEVESKEETSGNKVRQGVQEISLGNRTLDLPFKEKLHEEQEKQRDIKPALATTIINHKGGVEDEMEDCDSNGATHNSGETTESGESADDKKTYEEMEGCDSYDEKNNPGEGPEPEESAYNKKNCEDEEKHVEGDENTEELTENEEENIEIKLKLIELQLIKARELTSKEVLTLPRTEKQKLYLTEMLLRCILDLDTIETQGNETVKQARREAVREIQSYLDVIENDTTS